jgi:chaperonin GroEL
MFTSIKTKEDARGKMIKGVNLLADAVCSTLGPRGTNVIIGETSYPTITKDGVTVAQHVSPEDKFENMGVSLGRQASEKTNSVAGDGTTSTVAIFRDIINEGNKYIVAGMNPILIKKGMDDALQVALKELGKITKKLETREDKVSVATISANNDKELGEMIVDVIDGVGKDGVITVTTSNTFKTEVEYVNGMKLDS